jgi:hypothetical protein
VPSWHTSLRLQLPLLCFAQSLITIILLRDRSICQPSGGDTCSVDPFGGAAIGFAPAKTIRVLKERLFMMKRSEAARAKRPPILLAIAHKTSASALKF